VPKRGIVGLGQVGKTTLFRILTPRHASGLASGKQEVQVAVVRVPQPRLERLVAVQPGRPAVYTAVEYVIRDGDVGYFRHSG
jgi:ribosome-binding ATPase YchF (GTP1/OBG family)